MTLLPGRPAPRGATVRDGGLNVAVFAGHATAVELCLFEPDADGELAETQRLRLPACERGVWHGFLPGGGPGLVYGLRVHGPWDPRHGQRHNPHKLLLDPYARAVVGSLVWGPAVGGAPNTQDSAPFVPKAVVQDPIAPPRPGPRTPWRDTVIYEAHVKGMTAAHPGVPAPLRGTYLGLASEPIITHLLDLGVTAVELLPVHLAVTEERLARLGLENYWGYGTLGFFAPDPRFAVRPERARHEFAEMVDRLHAAGIEVLLDVVYNHTIEGPAAGPTLSLRGLDNRAYYRLPGDDPSRYIDWTGCGNTLDIEHPAALQLVLDSLRAWVVELGVDGFRFDLAPSLFREGREAKMQGRFAAALAQDPVLGDVKLIAEPWDLGPNGYQLGAFPAGWVEWNDRFRDTARRAWRGDRGVLPDLAERFAGSADLFGAGWDRAQQRGPLASVNFIACHDGFTLTDLTTWSEKRNEANGEDNRDGTNNNHACPWGPEGPTDAPEVLAARARAARNLLATTLLAQGVPMLGHGDELGRTQGGNNNAYCQDNEISWIDWRSADAARIRFVRELIAVRAGNGVFRRRTHFEPDDPAILWLRPDGAPMAAADWDRGERAGVAMGVLLAATGAHDERTALVLMNTGAVAVEFVLPSAGRGRRWARTVDTSEASRPAPGVPGDRLAVPPHSLILLEAG